MKETRLDRIERNLELLSEETREFRKFQKETTEQIHKIGLEMRESQKKTDEQFHKTDKQILELKESQKKTDEQLMATIKKLDRIGEQLADLGIVQGQIAEDLFYRNVQNLFVARSMEFSDIKRNMKKKGIAEYDIVAVNNGKVLVIEVKNKLEKRAVDKFVNEKLPSFRKVFPQYKDYQIIGGVGGLVIKDDVGRYAEKSGLYVLTQSDDGGASLINKKGFRAKEF